MKRKWIVWHIHWGKDEIGNDSADVIEAETAGKAKFRHFERASECWDVKYTDFRARLLRPLASPIEGDTR